MWLNENKLVFNVITMILQLYFAIASTLDINIFIYGIMDFLGSIPARLNDNKIHCALLKDLVRSDSCINLYSEGFVPEPGPGLVSVP